jgi:1-acyl-sn-glycerol-3-phosphate acyltransferase
MLQFLASAFLKLFGWHAIQGLPKFKKYVPVDRRVRSSVIEKMTEMFNNSERMVLGITPEGTRSKTEFWKSGFYYIALSAKVPICFAYLDYGNKKVGIGDHFFPTGDIKEDMKIIRNFYSGIKGKRPEKQGEVRVRPREDN